MSIQPAKKTPWFQKEHYNSYEGLNRGAQGYIRFNQINTESIYIHWNNDSEQSGQMKKTHAFSTLFFFYDQSEMIYRNKLYKIDLSSMTCLDSTVKKISLGLNGRGKTSDLFQYIRLNGLFFLFTGCIKTPNESRFSLKLTIDGKSFVTERFFRLSPQSLVINHKKSDEGIASMDSHELIVSYRTQFKGSTQNEETQEERDVIHSSTTKRPRIDSGENKTGLMGDEGYDADPFLVLSSQSSDDARDSDAFIIPSSTPFQGLIQNEETDVIQPSTPEKKHVDSEKNEADPFKRLFRNFEQFSKTLFPSRS